LLFALKKVGVPADTLSLASHGPFVYLMSKLSARDFDLYKLTLAVATCVFLSFGIFLEFRNRLVFSGRPIFFGMIVLLSLWLALAWLRYNPGRWTAVTQANGAPLRVTPDQQSEVVSQVGAGRPIFILGNTFDPWLRAYLSDGTSGWISALDVRVFHEAR